MLDRQSLERRITKFVKRIHRRNIRETIVAGALIAVFAYSIYGQREDYFAIVGGTVVIFALLLDIIILWWKLYIPKSELSTFPPTQFPDKWKQRLTRQARMLKLIWLWYLLPLFLGLFIYLLSVYDKSSLSFIILFLCEVALFVGTLRLNLRAAKQIERDRDTWFGDLRAG
ncbi:hypothetical protein B7486_23015 [cyanobacterium TDX16]|nr:hypothetical protein B7486_23015 [cyanobacterium TDX16]